LGRLSGQRVLHKIWLPLLRAKLGENYKETSAAFIWAVIARMYAARRAGMKREMFGYLPRGYARTIERFSRLLRKQNVQFRLGQPVLKVERDGDSGIRIQRESSAEVFDKAILTMAPPLAARMCSQLDAGEKERMFGVRYQGIICASVLLKEQLSDFYITNITADWVPFTAVIDMSALVDRKNLGGHGLVYLPKYVPPDAPEFKLTDEELRDRFLNALERMYPSFKREDVLSFRVSRVKYLLPISTIGYSRNLPPMISSIPGVYMVNSSQIVNGTLNVNETIQLAENAAKHLGALPAGEEDRYAAAAAYAGR
jgi:protoporphyrinogen oxidase